jgi:hypothetical protein
MNSMRSTTWAGYSLQTLQTGTKKRSCTSSATPHPTRRPMNCTQSTTWAGWPSDSANRYDSGQAGLPTLQTGMKKHSFYLFSNAAYSKEENELYAEYHLGRLAFRLCKQVLRSARFTSSAMPYTIQSTRN